MVPLELEISGKRLWLNAKPSSARLCRPLHLQYVKETPDTIRTDKDKFTSQIEKLEPTVAEIDVRRVQIKHDLALTMVDVKVINTRVYRQSQID